MTESDILDAPSSPPSRINVEQNLASVGKRFLNFVIDQVIVRVIIVALLMILEILGYGFAGNRLLGYGFTAVIQLVYYFVMEVSTGRTLGKLITGTRVVTEDGDKPRPAQILGRTFARLIPFEPFSCFNGVGWHDTLPHCRVVNIRLGGE